ncbi:MAG TPA: CPBP family intramembrane metalloprotease [Anaerolineae bacterium]|nr:CPBP family intramembrane metalloprotease [Anaerolineae bacterium]
MGLLEIFLIVALIMAANLVERSQDDTFIKLFDRFLLLLNIPLFVVGILLVFITPDQLADLGFAPGTPEFPFTNTVVVGVLLQAMAVWGIVFSFRSTRHSLEKRIPLNPYSPVQTLALVFGGWLVGFALLPLTQGLEGLAETAEPVSIFVFALQELAFFALALLGVGLFIRRTPAQVNERLGLGGVRVRWLVTAVGWILLLIVVQALAGALWRAINPEQTAVVESLNDLLYENIDSVWGWVILALAAGLGEETLFRGALQPVFGKWATALFFALIHVQYGLLTPATLALFIIGLSLGFIRERYNTTMAIIVHAGYNLILGLAVYYAGTFF